MKFILIFLIIWFCNIAKYHTYSSYIHTIFPNILISKNDENIELTHREFELLYYLAKHIGQVMTREHLLQTVWGYDYFGDVRTVDVTVRRLREKIEDNPSRPVWLVTRRGVGYYLRNPEAE